MISNPCQTYKNGQAQVTYEKLMMDTETGIYSRPLRGINTWVTTFPKHKYPKPSHQFFINVVRLNSSNLRLKHNIKYHSQMKKLHKETRK